MSDGLLDLQVNGFGGVDFNSSAVTVAQYRQAAERIWATGVARFLPTIITGDPDRMIRCLAAAAEAARDPLLADTIAGIHLEGPYISPEDGPRGAHPRQFVHPPGRDEFRRFQEAAAGQIRVVTLAPEMPGALPFIEWLAGQGIVVSIGHTGASPVTVRDAILAGASLSTHLGNGAYPTLPRHANYLWEQLAADELHASFIVDGHHLAPPLVKTFIRAKGVERSVLITDAVAPAGCQPGLYRIGEVDIELTAAGRVQLRHADRLAGSALQLDRAVGNAVRYAGISLAQALRMASLNPARVLRLPVRLDDAVLFEWDPQQCLMSVRATVCAGRPVYRA